MGIYNKMLNIMPYDCRYCVQGFLGMQHISEEARTQGMILIELQKTDAEKQPVWDTLETEDPIFVNAFGHGNSDVYTGNAELPIFTSRECTVLAGRITYLLSCLTANGLGPAIIANGGLAYGGYNISWTWMANSLEVDPYEDWYAEGFFRGSNEFPIALIQGTTVAEARDRCIAEYTRQIEIWETVRSDDEYAAAAIKWLIHDRDGHEVLGELNASIRTVPPTKVVLSVNSTPVEITFNIDDKPETTPYSAEVSGGLHVIEVQKVVVINEVMYIFRHWENDFTGTKRALWLEKDTVITATYEEAIAYTLTVNSEPDNVDFAINDIPERTPYSEFLEEGTYMVKFPSRFKRDEIWYGFDHWEDETGGPERIVSLYSDVTLKVYYTILATYTLSMKGLCQDEELPASVMIDDTPPPASTPFSVVLPEGYHKLRVFASTCYLSRSDELYKLAYFKNWDDGSTSQDKQINLTSNMSFTVYFELAGGTCRFEAKVSDLNQKLLHLTFGLDDRHYDSPVEIGCLRFGSFTLKFPPEHEEYVFNFLKTIEATQPFDYQKVLEKVVAYYASPAPRHTLSIDSSPIRNIPFKIYEASVTTPYSIGLIQGPYIVEVPRVALINGAYYIFKVWSDGYAYPKRTVELMGDTSLIGEYEQILVPQTSIFPIETGLDDGFNTFPLQFVSNGNFIPLNYRSWMRWKLKEIPFGAKILSAILKGYGYRRRESLDRGPVQIQHTDEDDAASFAANPYNRAVSGSIIEWLLPNTWWDNQEYSVDVTELLQDFVNRPTYRQGNHIAIRIEPVRSVDAQQFAAYDYNPKFSARLQIMWQPPVGIQVLKIETSPVTGILIKIDGVDVGVSPVTKTLVEGELTVEFQEEV